MKHFSLLRRGLIACALAAHAPAASISLNPIADAFVTSGSADPNAGSPSENYGAAGTLQVSAPGSKEGEMQSLMKFDFSTAKTLFDGTYGAGNWAVASIILQLGTNFGTQGQQPNNAIFNKINAGLFKIDFLARNNWTEGTGTPANPTTNGVTFSGPSDSLSTLESNADETLGTFTYTPVGNTGTVQPLTPPPASYSLSLDPTLAASFLADVSSGSDVSLRAYAGDTGVSYLFNSREFGTATNRPTLVVTAAPEPGSAALLGSAALIWFARRRCHARAA